MPVRVSEGLQVVSPWLYRPKPYALENHSLTVYFPNRHSLLAVGLGALSEATAGGYQPRPIDGACPVSDRQRA